MQSPRPILNQHRCARLIAWALALVNWVAVALHSSHAGVCRRIRQRAWFLDLDKLACVVRDLILIRACTLAKPRPKNRTSKQGAPARNIHLRRAAAGSRLRRALDHPDPIQRLSRLVRALRNVDIYARTVARRVERGLTRLLPRLLAPETAETVRMLALLTPDRTDSS